MLVKKEKKKRIQIRERERERETNFIPSGTAREQLTNFQLQSYILSQLNRETLLKSIGQIH